MIVVKILGLGLSFFLAIAKGFVEENVLELKYTKECTFNLFNRGLVNTEYYYTDHIRVCGIYTCDLSFLGKKLPTTKFLGARLLIFIAIKQYIVNRHTLTFFTSKMNFRVFV